MASCMYYNSVKLILPVQDIIENIYLCKHIDFFFSMLFFITFTDYSSVIFIIVIYMHDYFIIN